MYSGAADVARFFISQIQIWYINILILSLDNSSNVVHSAEQLIA